MRKQRTVVAALVAAGFLTALPAARADSIFVGTLGVHENCAPFGCSAVLDQVGYQQVYSSSVFDGPIEISSITFFDTFEGGAHGNDVDPGTFTISFSTTSAAVDGLSTTLEDNVGADVQEFFSGDLSGPIGGTHFTIVGTPFEYDPALGNLLMQVDMEDVVSVQPHTFYDANNGNGLFSRVIRHADDDNIADSVGLVTEFNRPVPEPTAIFLFGLGLAGLLRFRRRR